MSLLAWLALVLLTGPYSYHSRLMTLYNHDVSGDRSKGFYEDALLVFRQDPLLSHGSFSIQKQSRLVLPNGLLLLEESNEAQQRSMPWSSLLPKIKRSTGPRYNGIKYTPGRWSNRTKLAARRIRSDDHVRLHHERIRQLKKMDDETDDKDIPNRDRDRYEHYEERTYPREDGCYRPKWSFEQNSACNTVHEQLTMAREVSDLQRYEIEFLGRGHFRTSYRFTSVDSLVADSFVLKNIRMHERRNYNAFTFDQIQIEELGFMHTQGSDLTTNMYARCGTSVVVESGKQIRYAIYPVEDNIEQKMIDKIQGDDVVPFNKLTPEQKLKIALQMAEALALLHGNNEGVIVNDDVQVDQWLLGADGNLRLNDYNNAIILKWNPDRNEYCDFKVAYHYIFRSPQEVKRRTTDETSDVFALGLIMYTILTGFMPFYERRDWDASMQALQDGEMPYIDPRYRNRSLIEKRLVEIMEPTWEYYIEDRASIFDVVKGLRDTVDEYEKLHPGVTIRDVDLSNLPALDAAASAAEDEEYIDRMKELLQFHKNTAK